MTIVQWTKLLVAVAMLTGSAVCFGDFLDEDPEDSGEVEPSSKPTLKADDDTLSVDTQAVDTQAVDKPIGKDPPSDSGPRSVLPQADDDEPSPKPDQSEGSQVPTPSTDKTSAEVSLDQETSADSGSFAPGPKRSTGARDDPKKPISWQSTGLRGLKESGTIELIDEVLVSQGSLNVTADYAKVFFDNAEREVDKVVAEGDVKMSKVDEGSGERIKAFGDRVYFLNSERKVILEGNARLWRGADLIQGKKIIYEMETGWVHADRVSGEVYPGDEKSE